MLKKLYAQIGQQKVEIDWLKKNSVKPVSEKRAMIEKESNLSMRDIANTRSGLYYTPFSETEENLALMRLIDKQCLKTPFCGVPRLTQHLNRQGYKLNKKR